MFAFPGCGLFAKTRLYFTLWFRCLFTPPVFWFDLNPKKKEHSEHACVCVCVCTCVRHCFFLCHFNRHAHKPNHVGNIQFAIFHFKSSSRAVAQHNQMLQNLFRIPGLNLQHVGRCWAPVGVTSLCRNVEVIRGQLEPHSPSPRDTHISEQNLGIRRRTSE